MTSFLEEFLLEKMSKYTYVVLVQGGPQMGKSLFTWYLVNCLSMKKFGEAWDYEKYCARNLEEFVDMIDKFNERILVFEEASKDISIDRFYDDLNHFFNMIMQTQGYKHNLIFLVFPHSCAISNRQKYFINMGLEVVQRIEEQNCKATVVKPTVYKREFWKLEDHDIRYKWWGKSFIKYSEEDIKKSKEYTDWIISTLKCDVMKDIKCKIKRRKDREKALNNENFEYNGVIMLKN